MGGLPQIVAHGFQQVGLLGKAFGQNVAGTVQGNTGADGTLATDARYNLLPGILRLPNGDLITADAANQDASRNSSTMPPMRASFVK